MDRQRGESSGENAIPDSGFGRESASAVASGDAIDYDDDDTIFFKVIFTNQISF